MDATTLLENVLDPAHLPFTHHGTISNRAKAGPVTLTRRQGDMEGPAVGSGQPEAGFALDRTSGGVGSGVAFKAPNCVVSVTRRPGSFSDWNVVYAVPTSPGECRLLVRVVFETGAMANPQRVLFEALFNKSPAWALHANNHRVIEDDNIFLHRQEQNVLVAGHLGWRRFVLPTSADAGTVALRQWLESHGERGGPAWSPRARRMARGAAGAAREDLIERRRAHTEHCSACSGALSRAEAVKSASGVSAYLALVLSASASAGLVPPWIITWGAPQSALAYIGLSLCGAVAHALASDVIKRLTVGEYPPPRNRG